MGSALTTVLAVLTFSSEATLLVDEDGVETTCKTQLAYSLAEGRLKQWTPLAKRRKQWPSLTVARIVPKPLCLPSIRLFPRYLGCLRTTNETYVFIRSRF